MNQIDGIPSHHDHLDPPTIINGATKDSSSSVPPPTALSTHLDVIVRSIMIRLVGSKDIENIANDAPSAGVILAYISTATFASRITQFFTIRKKKKKQILPGHAAHSPEDSMCTSPAGCTKHMNLPVQIGMGSLKLLICVV
ncbi:hypothetical protein PAXRUDRAFT_834811 [Paxillus rubicundulus Ve08.2h10]|uniref:Uncharacterized protein n=1 Tax=Paxillus rubicundulus Ve08.2h10 TaxID=930991 RepID=A0A0D0DIL6_9AGAM|nr:hypothetical protein PAXRUDRAFT_834811 [Paxillus rubicundulus Ve08.2h10]